MRSNLLLVDDEESILFALRRYFSLAGYSVDCARQADEACALLDNKRYGAVIADVALSEGGGREGLEVVGHARRTNPNARIIMLTAYGSPELEREAFLRGIDVFVQKPKALSELAEIVGAVTEDQP